MSKVTSKDSDIEVRVRRELWRGGYRYRKHYGIGNADIAFPREKVAVFIDSCFWHACPAHGEIPATNTGFWRKKLEKNKERDREVTNELQEQRWTVVRLWEHEIKETFDAAIERVIDAIDVNRG